MPPKTLGQKNISNISKNDLLSAFAAKGNKKAQSMLQSNNQSSVSLQNNDVAQKMEELGAQANTEAQSIFEQSKNSDINMRESQAFLNGLDQTPQQQAAEVQEPPQGEPVVQDTYFAGITQTLQEQRSYYENQLKTQKDELDKRIAELKKEQQEIMKNVDSETQPFREDLEKAERERLSVEENFQANQRLTNELSSLLTQGNLLIQQRRGLPMNSRAQARLVNQSIEEVNARAGVIEAVMAARNNQIAQATTLIDRSLSAMNADRLDRLSFYETQLSLNNNEKTKLDAQSEAVYKEQMQLVKDDLTRAQTNADYIKGLMQNPETAQFMAEAGVTLNDSPEQVNQKMAAQGQREEIRIAKNELVEAGYDLLPYPAADAIEIQVGDQTLYARVRPGSELDLSRQQQQASIDNVYEQIRLARQRIQLDRDEYNLARENFESESAEFGTGAISTPEGEKAIVSPDGTVTPISQIDFSDPTQVDALPVSPLTKAVIQGIGKVKDFTPTQKAEITAELQQIGFNPNTYILNKLDSLVQTWVGVPEASRGLVEGNKFWERWTDEDVAKFESQKTLLTREIARLFDVGVLSDQDVQAYKDAMPSRLDQSLEVVLNKAAGIGSAAAGTNVQNVGQYVQLPDGRTAIVGIDGDTLLDPTTGAPIQALQSIPDGK